MKVKEIDKTKLDQVIAIQWQKAEHYKTSDKPRSQVQFYEYMARYFQKVKDAIDRNDFFVLHQTSIPVEIFECMGLPSVLGPLGSSQIFRSLKLQQQCWDACDEIGLNYGICNGHRSLVGIFLRGWFPKPGVVISMNGTQCDNVAKSLSIVAHAYDVPHYFIDLPYYDHEQGIQYLIGEFKDMIRFLEEKTGHRMDWAKFEEACHYTHRMGQISAEIGQLMKAVPAPMHYRSGGQQYLMHWMYAGTPEGVKWFETLRDEVKDRVDKGTGVHPNEKYRLMSLFLPHGNPKILDWLLKEHGAVVVSEPYYFLWRPDSYLLDPSKPLEFVARRQYVDPLHYITGPKVQEDRFLDVLVKEAIDSKADGAIDWMNIAGCRNHCTLSRAIKDAIKERADIPVGIVDVDLNNHSLECEEEVKRKLDDFVTVMEARKGVS